MKTRIVCYALILSYFLVGGCSWKSYGVSINIDPFERTVNHLLVVFR